MGDKGKKDKAKIKKQKANKKQKFLFTNRQGTFKFIG